MKTKTEVELLNKEIEKLILKLAQGWGLNEEEADRLLQISKDPLDNRHRSALRDFISHLQEEYPQHREEMEDFYKLAYWISLYGTRGVESIMSHFKVDEDGTPWGKFRFPLLQKLASLALRLASQEDHYHQDSFVRGPTLRTSPYDPHRPLNPRHETKMDLLRKIFRDLMRSENHFDLGKDIVPQSIKGDRPEEVMMHAYIDTLLEWTDQFSTALRGAKLTLIREISKKAQIWEATNLRFLEDLIAEAMEDSGGEDSLNDLIDKLFGEARAPFPPVDRKDPYGTKLPVRDYVTLLDDMDRLEPQERDYYLLQILRRYLSQARKVFPNPKEQKIARLILAGMLWIQDIVTPSLEKDLRRLLPEWEEVDEYLSEQWQYTLAFTDLALKYFGKAKVESKYGLRTDRGYLVGDPKALRSLFQDLLNTSLDPEDRRLLNQIYKDGDFLSLGRPWEPEVKAGEGSKYFTISYFLYYLSRRKYSANRKDFMDIRDRVLLTLREFMQTGYVRGGQG